MESRRGPRVREVFVVLAKNARSALRFVSGFMSAKSAWERHERRHVARFLFLVRIELEQKVPGERLDQMLRCLSRFKVCGATLKHGNAAFRFDVNYNVQCSTYGTKLCYMLPLNVLYRVYPSPRPCRKSGMPITNTASSVRKKRMQRFFTPDVSTVMIYFPPPATYQKRPQPSHYSSHTSPQPHPRSAL